MAWVSHGLPVKRPLTLNEIEGIARYLGHEDQVMGEVTQGANAYRYAGWYNTRDYQSDGQFSGYGLVQFMGKQGCYLSVHFNQFRGRSHLGKQELIRLRHKLIGHLHDLGLYDKGCAILAVGSLKETEY